jgi:4-hydroxythreonine-4-phosphate dehydrogenase
VSVVPVEPADLASGGPEMHSIEVLETGPDELPERGDHSASGGEHAYRAVEAAVKLSLDGVFSAIVTAPLSKRSLSLAGHRDPGHTELLCRLAGAPAVHMMMASTVMRVTLITRHIPLAEVPRALTRERIVQAGMYTWQALTDMWGYASPRLAMAGLNPHAGEQSMFGDEEERVVRPALDVLRSRGVVIEGPFPADTLFLGYRLKMFHAFLACYHDQGLIPFKTASFGKGVNVTLGLPFIRTSVDHGTAFDIAGRGHASTDSLREAVDLATALCRNWRGAPWKGAELHVT